MHRLFDKAEAAVGAQEHGRHCGLQQWDKRAEGGGRMVEEEVLRERKF